MAGEEVHEPEPSGTEYAPEEREVLSFLATSKRVDLRWLNEERKAKLRTVLDGLHNGKKISLLQISKDVGRSYFSIWGLCRSLGIRTRGVAEAQANSSDARSKHKRRPFDGTEEDRAYMTGFKNGDLTAWQVSGTAVMVTSSTTHRAFADLFHQLFQGYAHVYQYPMFEEGKGYKWKLAARLDNSFRFLLKSAQEAAVEFGEKRTLYLSWLAGLIDSDGNIHVSQDKGRARVRVTIYNSNKQLLYDIIKESLKIGYTLNGPYLLAEVGMVTPRGIRYTKDHWQIAIQQSGATQRLLSELPLRHAEKVERKRLALKVGDDGWDEINAVLQELKTRIKADVKTFCDEAEESYKQRRRSAAGK